MQAPEMLKRAADLIFAFSLIPLTCFNLRNACGRGTHLWVLANNIWQETKCIMLPSNCLQLVSAVANGHQWTPWLWLLNLAMWEFIVRNDRDDDDRWGKRRKKLKARLRASVKVLKPSLTAS